MSTPLEQNHPINLAFSNFKQQFANQLSKSKDLLIEDVEALVIPLALE